MKLKNLWKNNLASGYGVLAVLVPFILSTTLTVVFLPIDVNTEFNYGSMGIMPKMENYSNKTKQERIDYLVEKLGHGPIIDDYDKHWEFTFDLDFLTEVYVEFQDGYHLNWETYLDYIEGKYDKPNYVDIVLGILFIDPPALGQIGEYGVYLRIIMLVSVALGLAELLWIG